MAPRHALEHGMALKMTTSPNVKKQLIPAGEFMYDLSTYTVKVVVQ